MASPRRTPGNRFSSLMATCRRISRRRHWSWRLSAFGRPSESGSDRSQSVVRKQLPTTRAPCRRRSKRCCNPISGPSSDVRARGPGLEETTARFDAYPAALQAALGAKATDLAAALADLVKNDKLSGAVLNTRSGALRDSIAASVTAEADGFLASVGSEGDVNMRRFRNTAARRAHTRSYPRRPMCSPLSQAMVSISRAGSSIPAR